MEPHRVFIFLCHEASGQCRKAECAEKGFQAHTGRCTITGHSSWDPALVPKPFEGCLGAELSACTEHISLGLNREALDRLGNLESDTKNMTAKG